MCNFLKCWPFHNPEMHYTENDLLQLISSKIFTWNGAVFSRFVVLSKQVNIKIFMRFIKTNIYHLLFLLVAERLRTEFGYFPNEIFNKNVSDNLHEANVTSLLSVLLLNCFLSVTKVWREGIQ